MENISDNNNNQNKVRIEWIDMAKGVAILLVIIGHTAPFGGTVRNFIFSFHMPFFFIISGYTSSTAKSWSSFPGRMAKNFLRLALPCILAEIFLIVLNLIVYGKAPTMWYMTDRLQRDFWACGVDFWKAGALGMFWFLVAMFWGRLIYDVICIIFKKWAIIPGLVVAGFGYLLGIKFRWMPQSLDLAMVVTGYMAIGHLAKTVISKRFAFSVAFTIFSAIFWLLCLHNGIYIEMATRSYPQGIISILESLCGTWIFCQIFAGLQWLFDSVFPAKIQCIKKALVFLGTNSMLIYFIHNLDFYLSDFWSCDDWHASALLRIICILLVAGITAGIRRLYIRIKN